MNSYDYYVSPEEYAAAAAIGISKMTLEYRIRRYGWSKQRALTEPPKPRQARSHWRRIAETNGIPENTFYARVNNMGWTEERAATEPICEKPYELAAKSRRRIPREIIELAAANGIPLSTFKSRYYHSGWDLHQAATTPIISASEAGRRGAAALRSREGDWAAQIFKKRGEKIL